MRGRDSGRLKEGLACDRHADGSSGASDRREKAEGEGTVQEDGRCAAGPRGSRLALASKFSL